MGRSRLREADGGGVGPRLGDHAHEAAPAAADARPARVWTRRHSKLPVDERAVCVHALSVQCPHPRRVRRAHAHQSAGRGQPRAVYCDVEDVRVLPGADRSRRAGAGDGGRVLRDDRPPRARRRGGHAGHGLARVRDRRRAVRPASLVPPGPSVAGFGMVSARRGCRPRRALAHLLRRRALCERRPRQRRALAPPGVPRGVCLLHGHRLRRHQRTPGSSTPLVRAPAAGAARTGELPARDRGSHGARQSRCLALSRLCASRCSDPFRAVLRTTASSRRPDRGSSDLRDGHHPAAVPAHGRRPLLPGLVPALRDHLGHSARMAVPGAVGRAADHVVAAPCRLAVDPAFAPAPARAGIVVVTSTPAIRTITARDVVLLAGLLLVVLIPVRYETERAAAPGAFARIAMNWEIVNREAWTQGTLPLWNPYQFGGRPHLANPETLSLYPPHMLLRFLPLTLFFSLSLALHTWLAGAGTYFAARALGASRPVSALASGAVVGGRLFVPFEVRDSPLDVYGVAWVPLIAAFSIRSSESYRWLPHPGLVVVVALSVLASALKPTYALATVVGSYLFAAIWHRSRAGRRRHLLVQAIVLAGLAVGLTAVQIVPTVRLDRKSVV